MNEEKRNVPAIQPRAHQVHSGSPAPTSLSQRHVTHHRHLSVGIDHLSRLAFVRACLSAGAGVGAHLSTQRQCMVAVKEQERKRPVTSQYRTYLRAGHTLTRRIPTHLHFLPHNDEPCRILQLHPNCRLRVPSCCPGSLADCPARMVVVKDKEQSSPSQAVTIHILLSLCTGA